jgi:uncharacterized membrane protein
MFDNILHVASAAQTDWGALHPILVHFPIVLLTIAPLFLLAAFFCGQQRFVVYGFALTLILLGTLSLYIAASSGEMAAEHLQPPSATVQTLDIHYQLAELAEKIFLGLSVLGTALLMVFRLRLSRLKRSTEFAAIALFLLLYAGAMIVLLNTAHYGGKLVHEHHIHTSLYTKDHR